MSRPRRKIQAYRLTPLDSCLVGSAQADGSHSRLAVGLSLGRKATTVVLSSSVRVCDRTSADQVLVARQYGMSTARCTFAIFPCWQGTLMW